MVPTDTLVALLWGEDPPASVAVTLRSVASRLRGALGAAGERVRAHDGGYVARVDPESIDVRAFEDFTARGRALLADDRPDELGVDPHPDLRRLHQRILRQDPTLSPVRRALPHLPAALTPLVGRDDERGRLCALLRETRPVTLTGVGGVGKARLALQVAADLLADFPDGVRLIELGPLPDPARVAAHLAAVFGVTESADPLDRVADALHGQRLLGVVDNCEHLVATARAEGSPLARVS